jgi:hypothetical protein
MRGRAGELLGIPPADHIVLGEGDSCFTFCERGLVRRNTANSAQVFRSNVNLCRNPLRTR